MSNPLPWVKAHTRVLTSIKWLAIPIAERGVFDHLCRLGGVGTKRGYVEGTDEQIALLIRCDTNLVTQTVDRLSGKPYESLRRRRGGVVIVNWDQYQAPPNYDPDANYGRKPTVRVTESRPFGAPIGRVEGEGEGEGEGEREGEKRLLAALREVPGYPFDPEKDVLFATQLVADFPSVDLAGEARKWAAYKLDRPFNARSSPRSQFRTWVSNALRFAARDASRGKPTTLSVEEQLAEKHKRWSA